MSRTHEVCWAAGFFDGEGYITIQERGHKDYVGFYLRIGVNHVAIEPLLELQRLFGGTIEKQNPDKVVGNRKQRHRWCVSTRIAEDVLRQMIPYFKNKNKVAELALEFQKTIGSRGEKLSVETQIYRRLLKEKITHLNSLD